MGVICQRSRAVTRFMNMTIECDGWSVKTCQNPILLMQLVIRLYTCLFIFFNLNQLNLMLPKF